MKEIIAKLLEITKLIFGFLFSKTYDRYEILEEEYSEPPVVEEPTEDLGETITDLVLEESAEENLGETIKEEEVEEQEEIIVTTLPEEDVSHHVMNTELTEEDMFWIFVNEGMNYYGASGLLANLYAESGLKANNLQNSYNTKLGMSDEEYTTAVDDGTYHNFVGDSAGYGLAQWTYWTRKQNLLDYAISTGRSIGDTRMQCEFLIKELKESYKSVFNTLCTATSVLEASNAVLLKFERPYDQSETVQEKRASFGQKYYDKYAA